MTEFKKGNKHSKGRPPGSKNKDTIASIYRRIIIKSLQNLDRDADDMTVEQKIEQLERLDRLHEKHLAKHN